MINQAWSCVECPRCYGTGYVEVLTDEGRKTESCPLCNGSGELKQYHDSSSLSERE